MMNGVDANGQVASEPVVALVARSADEPIALLTKPLPALGSLSGVIKAGDFLGHVLRLAGQLPEGTWVLNLCDNRYLFMVAFCAAIVRGQTTLLPPNKNIATQRALKLRYDKTYIIHDGRIELAPGIPALAINECCLAGDSIAQSPVIALDFLAAIAFTSGSTGDSQAHPKPWHTFVESTEINCRYMLGDGKQANWALATVPGQHMWGMETSVLLALRKSLCVVDDRPLFPKDIVETLKMLPSPKVLITTPVHLRALCHSGIELPQVELILSATAPLGTEQAQEAENLFKGQLREVYGCSEVGSMACRRTALEEYWQLFDGLQLQEQPDRFVVSAGHLPKAIVLQDRLEKHDDRHFRLLGRGDDMVEIAGKRGSLQEINRLLLSTPGVLDGVVFRPESNAQVVRLCALVVLDDVAHFAPVVQHLREHLDPVFVPRPCYQVAALPRETSGKLPRRRLLSFFEEIKSAQASTNSR